MCKKARSDALLAEAGARFQAQRVRSLVAAAQSTESGPPTSEGMTLAAWASAVADEIDPLGPLQGPAAASGSDSLERAEQSPVRAPRESHVVSVRSPGQDQHANP